MEAQVKWHYGSIDSELAAKAKASIRAGGKAGVAAAPAAGGAS